MKYFTYLVISFLLIIGCKPGIPGDVLRPDKMALLLHDIHVFDGYITNVTNIDTAKKVAAGYYNAIYKKYDTDSATYVRSLKYYTVHPKEMTQIYTKVTDQLKKEKNSLVKADSLKNAKLVKASKLKLKTDSVKKSDSLKIDLERKKFKRQMDSLKESGRFPMLKSKAKKAAYLKKRTDSLNKINQRKKIKKANL
ncbi:MAG TPA: DUF4296 domain-containing protein [Pedobacter sp.]|nr:DUF4296 domain-containing protein [Pedobacter sp.]